MMAAKKPLKKKVVKKPVKKVVKKPVKKVAKKPVKKVAKKPVKKVAKKRAGQSYALSQRNSVGGGTGSITGLVQELVGTLLNPTQLAFVGLWGALVLKYVIFYDQPE